MTISIPDSRTISISNDDQTISMITGDDVYQPLGETTSALAVLKTELEKKDSLAGLKLADFGAGTGQLGILAKKFFPELDVHTYENDLQAEKYIAANAELHEVDITSHMVGVADISNSEKFDVVISCPPFFPDALKKVGYNGNHATEPENAVYGGVQGMEVQQVFIAKAANVLNQGGFVIIVHSEPQKDLVLDLLPSNQFENVETHVINTGEDLDLVDAIFTVAYKK